MTTRGLLSQVANMLAPSKSIRQEPAAPSIDRQDSVHWVEHGNRLRETGENVGALNAYREAIAAATYGHQPYVELGHLYRLQGQCWAALESYVRAAVQGNPLIAIDELTDLDWFDRKEPDDRDAVASRASITDMLLHAAAICTDTRLIAGIILPVAARSFERPILKQLLTVLDVRGLVKRAESEHVLQAMQPAKALDLSSADIPILHNIDTQRQVPLH